MKKKVQSKIAKCLCGGIKIKIFGKLRHVITVIANNVQNSQIMPIKLS